MTAYDDLQRDLRAAPRTWLVTGVAGFIGSHLLETLLGLDQRVVGLDNFSTGKQANLELVRAEVPPERWARFQLIKGDVADSAACSQACAGVDYVLHQAGLGSVPRSLLDPAATHRANVTGSLNLLVAARHAKAARLVYASSSSVYGDAPELPKTESRTGQPLSPYAASKAMAEMYASVFARAFGLASIGLRYFNVFGPRQDPDGAYAAVIPRWIAAVLKREPVYINGDGETSRDFCYVSDVVQANLLAATTPGPEALNQVYNIAVGQRTTLNQLFQLIKRAALQRNPTLPDQPAIYREFRAGDITHSLADISRAQRLLRYAPTHQIAAGLDLAIEWYWRMFQGGG